MLTVLSSPFWSSPAAKFLNNFLEKIVTPEEASEVKGAHSEYNIYQGDCSFAPVEAEFGDGNVFTLCPLENNNDLDIDVDTSVDRSRYRNFATKNDYSSNNNLELTSPLFEINTPQQPTDTVPVDKGKTNNSFWYSQPDKNNIVIVRSPLGDEGFGSVPTTSNALSKDSPSLPTTDLQKTSPNNIASPLDGAGQHTLPISLPTDGINEPLDIVMPPDSAHLGQDPKDSVGKEVSDFDFPTKDPFVPLDVPVVNRQNDHDGADDPVQTPEPGVLIGLAVTSAVVGMAQRKRK